ncbi:MAG: DUF1501 domain-containing protein [Planctomycetota bacterium]|nr:DUF1501 domain-containing protein [Planctomycetota bacterium]
MKAEYACNSNEHQMERRRFLGVAAGAGIAAGTGVAAGAGVAGMAMGVNAFSSPLLGNHLAQAGKRVIVFNMSGGLSQLESWDPKPGTKTGGPFRAIPTSVTGIHVSELLPMTARQMHHLCLVRGVNTSENDHGKGRYMMFHGRKQMPGGNYPALGAVAAKALSNLENPLPGHVLITNGGGGGRNNDSAYLGPRFASISLGNGKPPQNTTRPKNVTENADRDRQEFRRKINQKFLSRRRSAMTEAFTYSYEQALQMMEKRDVFDLSKEPADDLERYGKHDLGQHCVLARRMLEKGISYVQVSHSNYDTHNENFNFHIEQLGEFDQAFSNLVSDLAERGMLESTLIVVLSEFGRTPRINQYYGRDHWGKSWSICMGGGSVARGHAYGQTNAEGTEVTDGQVDHADLFHTYLQAVDVDSTDSFDIDGRQLPIADPATEPVHEILT